MPTLALRRRDPWWGLEGPAARRRHRYERFVSTTAFLASLVALGGAGWRLGDPARVRRDARRPR